MKYCNGANFTNIWIYNAINPCFQETVTSTILFLFTFTAGCFQCHIYKKSAKRIGPIYKPTSCGLFFQVVISILFLTEILIRIIILDTAVGSPKVYGFHLYRAVLLALCWIISIRLLFIERDKALPESRVRGHGWVLIVFWSLVFVNEVLYLFSWNNDNFFWKLKNDADVAEFSLWVIRLTLCSLLLILGVIAPSRPRTLHNIFENKVSKSKKKRNQDTTWSNVLEKVRMMLPYIWPKGSFYRQILVFICGVILIAGRVITVFVPVYAKDIIDSLSPSEDPVTGKVTKPVFRWDLVLVWSLLLYLKGGGSGSTGFLNNTRSFLWITIQQFTTRKIQLKFLTHLHSLSLRWHLERKTGEVLRVVDRGTKSINNLLNYVMFNVFPTLVDVVVAIVYFVTAFDYIFGILVFLTMAFYLGITIWITEWRTKFRREQNIRDNQCNQTAVDSLLNFETVKYYGAQDVEVNRYDEAILRFQSSEWKSSTSLNLLSAVQNFVISVGLLTGSLLCAYAVTIGINGVDLTVGDYILFGTYLTQLYAPLNWIGTYYRMIQQAFVDMENMFELLEEQPEVEDKPGALNLSLRYGEICFKDVFFSYEKSREVLHGVSFTVPSGKTFALVGPSGSGKSTIIRLLFRFYDVSLGSITIDGQDISMVRQNSLRKQIGVVPQDTVLFNADIRYNIRYGHIHATDDDVKNAADAADIHDRIEGFPEGYDTVVGERGLKLSGGEKQRVAIARTILKNPAIVLLDEATSALDTRTERIIQTSLENICAERTTIIVAHRLSTVIHADQILVMKDGRIEEKGTHDDLLMLGGIYKDMWDQQQCPNLRSEFSATSSMSSVSSADDNV